MTPKINCWIVRQWIDGKSASGRPRRRSEKINGIRGIKSHDVILVRWSVGRQNGESKMALLGKDGYKVAEEFRREKLKELLEGKASGKSKRSPWSDFRKLFERERLLPGQSEWTHRDYFALLNQLETILKLKWVEDLDDAAIYRFRSHLIVGESKSTKGKQRKPASVNKSLRYVKSILNFAQRRGFEVASPNVIEMMKQPETDTAHLPDEDLQAILEVVDQAKLPVSDAYETSDWWKAFLMIQRSCGLRVGECLDLKWDWVRLDKAELILPVQKNGKRTRFPLGPKMVELLKQIQDVHPNVFPFDRHRKKLYDIFGDLQRAAGISKACFESERDASHTCTPSCGVYGFHSLRRSFCHYLSSKVPMQVLKSLARHSSIQTTAKHYLNDQATIDDAGPIGEPDFR